MKARIVKAKIALVSLSLLAIGVSCSQDNSVGPDTVAGQAGTGAGQAGSNGSGTGGTSAISGTGTAGTGNPTGTGGSGPAASGTAGTNGPGTGGSGTAGTGTGGTGTGVGGSASAGSGGRGGGGAGRGGSTGAGGVVGTGGTGVSPMGNAGQGGPSLCPLAGTTLCDGFEDATTTPGPNWTTSGPITVDTTKSYRGSKSIKFSDASMAYITETKTFTGTTKATNNEFWGRYFFLSNVAYATYPQGHTVFGTLAGGPSDSLGDQFHFVGGSRAQLMAQIRINNGDKYTDPNGKNAGGTEPKFPASTDGWQCWEWHVTADDSYNFYINGTEVTEMAIVKGMATYGKMTLSPFPLFASLALGWQSFSGGAVVSGWIDEVALGPSRIGCGN